MGPAAPANPGPSVRDLPPNIFAVVMAIAREDVLGMVSPCAATIATTIGW